MQAANLRGFHASRNPRFEGGSLDCMDGIQDFTENFNTIHRKVHWWNPRLKSLNSMPDIIGFWTHGLRKTFGVVQIRYLI